MLIFTSGTTGRAKAAVLSHRSIIAYSMLQNFIGARGMVLAGRGPTGGPPPVRLAVFPLFHVSGLGATVNSIHTGSTTVWPLGRFDAGTVIDLTVRYGINLWGGTGTHVLRLVEHDDIDRIDPAQLLTVGMGGSATTPDIIRRVEAAFPHLEDTMSTGYGSTETGALVSYAPNWMLVASPDCIGPPLPTVDVRITGPMGEVLPDGEEGVICVRSPLLMTGYYRNDAANAEAFDDGRWFNTGDFGRLDGGVLHIASRKRDLIIRGGENVYPFEVENRLDEHDEIVEAAVIGVDHPDLRPGGQGHRRGHRRQLHHRRRRAGPLRRDARVVQGADPRRGPHRAPPPQPERQGPQERAGRRQPDQLRRGVTASRSRAQPRVRRRAATRWGSWAITPWPAPSITSVRQPGQRAASSGRLAAGITTSTEPATATTGGASAGTGDGDAVCHPSIAASWAFSTAGSSTALAWATRSPTWASSSVASGWGNSRSSSRVACWRGVPEVSTSRAQSAAVGEHGGRPARVGADQPEAANPRRRGAGEGLGHEAAHRPAHDQRPVDVEVVEHGQGIGRHARHGDRLGGVAPRRLAHPSRVRAHDPVAGGELPEEGRVPVGGRARVALQEQEHRPLPRLAPRQPATVPLECALARHPDSLGRGDPEVERCPPPKGGSRGPAGRSR